MATTTNPEPAATVSASAKLTAVIKACIKADVQKEIALDNYRNLAKSETVRLNLSDRKSLTAVLFASGDSDARRVSEIVGFVFPASPSAHAELEKAMEQNAKQTDPKKRISKQVILDLQRDKTGKLTLVKAQAEHKSRKANGKTNQTTTPTKKLTPKEIEESLGNLFAAALTFAKKHEYDSNDIASVIEEQYASTFGGTAEVSIEQTPAEEEQEETQD